MDKEQKCAGCNTTIPVRQHANTEVELFPGIKVWLCAGRERVVRQLDLEPWVAGTANVAAPCLRRARERLARCPGCGEEGQPPGTLCRACRAAIKRSGELEGARGALRWYALDLSGFIPYLSDIREDTEKLRERFGRLLMRACAAGRYSDRLPDDPYIWIGGRDGWVGCPAAEMTDDQVEALGELIDLLRPLLDLYTSHGEENGASIIRQLLDGKLSTADLDERTERRLVERAKLLDKLAGKPKGKR